MALAALSGEKIRYGATAIDNEFISDFMLSLGENALKTYLYGIYAATSGSEEQNTAQHLALKLKLTENEILACFQTLEQMGLVEITCKNPLSVKYQDLKSTAYRSRRIKPEKYSDFSLQVQKVLSERMIAPNEFNEYYLFIEERKIEPNALIMIIKYCTDLKGINVSYKYILTVAADWVAKGLTTSKSVAQEITDREKIKSDVYKILAALKLKRNVDNDDGDYYLKWTKEYGFDMNGILYAVTLLKDKKGGLKKLDWLLGELYKNKAFSENEMKTYTENADNMKRIAKNVVRELGLWYDVLDPVINYYVQPWMSLGFTEESIMFAASYCTKKNKRRLEEMDDLMKSFYKQGLLTYGAIADHVVNIAGRDKRLKEILSEAGLNCAVNKWYRENYARWSEEWGFSDEVITYAAAISCGKVNPIPYMNAVLGNFKSKGITTVEQAKGDGIQPAPPTNYNSHNRKYTEEELNILIEGIDSIEI